MPIDKKNPAKAADAPKAPAKKAAAPAKSGAARSTTTEAVSSKANPAPKTRANGNTAETRPAKPSQKVEAQPKAAKATPKPKDDHTEATGRDHPSQSEHMHKLFEKLHGGPDQRANQSGGPPKPGFSPKGGFNVKNQVKGGTGPRRTQGKGG
jgi:hypothetical protein